MNHPPKTNLCYVFSSSTMGKAHALWLESRLKTQAKDEEILRISAVALPWFLEHFQQNASIYMFTENDLLKEIDIWKDLQIEAYPEQTKRIQQSCDLILTFFKSDIVKNHKMTVDA